MSFAKPKWTVRLVRHATLTVNVHTSTFLVDPMLSAKGAMDPVANAGNDIRIPMVDLPIPAEQVVKNIDAVLLTHTHRDHWDTAAQDMIDKSMPIFCQPSDLQKIQGQSFFNVNVIEDKVAFKGVGIHRTGGQHGVGDIGQKMGTVSGFVVEYEGDKLYIAGDTIWCEEVEQTIKKFNPPTIVINTGGAEFLTGGPITMNANDVKTISKAAPQSRIIAVHMNTVNHCKVTRDILRKFVAENNLANVIIPADGETLMF